MAKVFMCPAHPRWPEFKQRLIGEEGCDFRWDAARKEPMWTCDSTTTKAERLLKSMSCDVEASINFFKEVGGFCDCEILFNVEQEEEKS